MNKVLIVDDKIENIYLLQSMLDTNGFKTISAKNGAEALGLLRTIIPDLIIADILMPVMDGFTLCRECKKDEMLKNIPFFFYTATYTDAKDEEYALSLGADRFILKPQEPDDFIKIINDFLNEVKKKSIHPKKIVPKPETVVLKEYNEVLIRKVEDKMLQTEKAEKELKKYSEELEKEIEERKKKEICLQQSQHLFETLANVSPVGIFRTDSDGNTTYVNPKWVEISGLSSEEALGNDWLNSVHPEDRRKLSESWAENSKSKDKSSAEYRFLRPDGTIAWVIGNAVPEIIDNEVTGYIGTITDITDRKRSEEALLEREQRLSSIYQTVGDVIYHLAVEPDETYRFISVNQAFYNVTGLREEMILGKLVNDIIPEPSLSEVLKKYKQAIKENSVIRWEEVSDYPNGKLIGDVSIAPVIDISRKCTHLVGSVHDITERKRSEEALVQSELKYRELVTQSPDGIFIVDLSGNFVSVNKAICDTLKYTEEELLLKNIFEIVPEKFHAIHKQRLGIILKGESTTSSSEYEVIGKDGIAHFIEVISVPYFSAKKIVGFQGIARDITDRKKVEKDLQESEEKYRRIFENVQDMFFETSIDGIILEVSPSLELISKGQYKRDDVIGKSMLNFFNDPAEGVGLLTALMNHGFISDYEILLKNFDGSLIPCSVSSRIWYNAKNVPIKIIGSMRDITDRKNTLMALRESEEKFRSIMENSADAIFLTNMNGRYTYTNRAVTEMLGYTKSEMLEKTILDISPKERINEYLEIFKSIPEKDKVFVEIELIKNDGTKVSVDLNSVVLPGNIIYGSCRDISERKKFEDELIRSKVKAEESDKLKTAFLHNISHEIRTPMNAIVGFSALLTEPGLDKDSMSSYIETITQSSNQLLAIINDIIEIANIEAGILKSSKNEIQINVVFQRLFDQFYPMATEKSLTLRKETPLSDNEAIIQSDNTKFIQILTNLLSNAFKFTQRGRVEFGYNLTEGFLHFYVSDTGIGIPEDQFKKIFDRFYQVDHMMARHFEGTGLGLSISKAFVEIMGGKIWVDSELGKGSVFYFTLPYNKQKATATEALTSIKETSINRQVSILVAEDDENNFNLIRLYLNFPKITLIRAKNGVEALKYCESGHSIDLVLMDLKMPEMDGYEATKKIKKIKPDLPVIAQTAFVTDNEKAYNSGCVDIITKPFSRRSLLEKIEWYLKD
jgi:PAS domain S-box-containing protein